MTGRRGVLAVDEAIRLTHKKIEDKEKFEKFTQKFGGSFMQDMKVPGQSYASYKDLA